MKTFVVMFAFITSGQLGLALAKRIDLRLDDATSYYAIITAGVSALADVDYQEQIKIDNRNQAYVFLATLVVVMISIVIYFIHRAQISQAINPFTHHKELLSYLEETGQLALVSNRNGMKQFSQVASQRPNSFSQTSKILKSEHAVITNVLDSSTCDVQESAKNANGSSSDNTGQYIFKNVFSQRSQIGTNDVTKNPSEYPELRETESKPQPDSKPRASSIDEKFIIRARQVIEQNIDNGTFGVEQLASEMNLSRTQLFRKFKAIIRIPPSDFINDIRLDKAAVCIAQRTDKLSQIAYAVGFNDPSYFGKCFRKKFGVSPREYQARN